MSTFSKLVYGVLILLLTECSTIVSKLNILTKYLYADKIYMNQIFLNYCFKVFVLHGSSPFTSLSLSLSLTHSLTHTHILSHFLSYFLSLSLSLSLTHTHTHTDSYTFTYTYILSDFSLSLSPLSFLSTLSFSIYLSPYRIFPSLFVCLYLISLLSLFKIPPSLSFICFFTLHLILCLHLRFLFLLFPSYSFFFHLLSISLLHFLYLTPLPPLSLSLLCFPSFYSFYLILPFSISLQPPVFSSFTSFLSTPSPSHLLSLTSLPLFLCPSFLFGLLLAPSFLSLSFSVLTFSLSLPSLSHPHHFLNPYLYHPSLKFSLQMPMFNLTF